MQHAPKRILVVDDEPDILEFLQEVLEEEGDALPHQKSSSAVIQLAGSKNPSWILC